MPERRNRSELFRDRARQLRRDQNLPEALVWERLRGRRLKGFKFRRQHPIGNYIADFYCAEAALVVELDGITHRGKEAYDARRQAWLESQGLLVLRFTNHDLLEAFDEFFEVVWMKCVERTKPSEITLPLPGTPGRGPSETTLPLPGTPGRGPG